MEPVEILDAWNCGTGGTLGADGTLYGALGTRGTVCVLAHQQTVVLLNVLLSINQQWEPWSLGNLVSHSSSLPIILEPCFLSFCVPSLCYYPFILSLFLPLSSLRIVSHYPFTLFPFVLSPILLWPIISFPSSSFHLVSHHPFILLSSGILSPCILSPIIPLSCLRSSLRLVSLIILSFITLYPVIPHHPTAKSSWVQSLKAEQPVQRLRPQPLAMHPGPHHFVSHHPFICLPSFCFVPSPAIPASPTTESSWVESLEAGGRFSHHLFISSLFIFYPFILSPFIWSLIVLFPHHPFIWSPFMLSAFIFSPIIVSLSCPPLPSSYFPASLHVVSAFPPICFL